MTRDGYLVVSHNSCLKEVTNAADYDDLWQDRLRSYTIMPEKDICNDDFAIPDFDLAEIKQLWRK